MLTAKTSTAMEAVALFWTELLTEAAKLDNQTINLVLYMKADTMMQDIIRYEA